jgi:hypothetical protein
VYLLSFYPLQLRLDNQRAFDRRRSQSFLGYWGYWGNWRTRWPGGLLL